MSTGTSRRGFASMDPDRQREIARRGGASVPKEKRSFSQDRKLAAEAGRKGGETTGKYRRIRKGQADFSPKGMSSGDF